MNLQNGTLEHPIMGTSGDDIMTGTAADDFFYGAGGKDNLEGGDGNDYLRAGQVWSNGAWHPDTVGDLLFGGNGNDTLEGGAGDDVLDGGGGYDELYGLDGDDVLQGGYDGGYLSGGDGNDSYLINNRHTAISSTNQAGDRGYIQVDWYKTNQSVTNWTWAPNAQKLPYWIDALTYDNIQDLAERANHVVKYNFVTTPPAWFSAADKTGFTPFTEAEKAQARQIFAYISSVIDVKFVETTNTDTAYTISLANNKQSPQSGGYASEIWDSGSSILLNSDPRVLNPSRDGGSDLNYVLIHEIGHALGLKHPFSHEDAAGNTGEGPYLPVSEDLRTLTVMSYSDDYSRNVPMSYSPYDLAALQYIWGVSSKANAGDTTYGLDTSKAAMVYDGAGFDTIDWSNATQNVMLDLRSGYQSYVGHKTELFNSPGQLTINFGTVIEAAKGGYGNDTIIGNEADNNLMGYEGNDIIKGGDGADTLQGGSGDDQLFGDGGFDEIYGLAGNDTLHSGADGAYLEGGDGNDTYIIEDRYTVIAHKNTDGDRAIVQADWFKTNSDLAHWEFAPGVQKLPYWIDALTYSNITALEVLAPQDHVIKYSFVTAPPSYFDTEDKTGFQAFTAEQQAYTRKVLAYFSSVIGVSFVETSDPSGPFTIALANNTQTDSAGYATEMSWTGGSKLLLDATAKILNPNLDNGSEMNYVLIHELSHALGLKHPFADADAGSNVAEGPYLPTAEDQRSHTVMSYTDDTHGPVPLSLADLDIAALQYLWGTSSQAHIDNTSYSLDANQSTMIYDGAGNDTLDGSLIGQDMVVDLRPGYWSYIGKKSELITDKGQITINFGTTIENLLGGGGNDNLTGNDADNLIEGGNGNDHLRGLGGYNTLHGGAGIDTAVYSGKHTDYDISVTGDVTQIFDHYAVGYDILSGVERLQFSDTMVALDFNGTAGQAYRLYRASFDRAPDLPGLGYWISKMDNGMKLEQVASGFLYSDEFQRLYGKNVSNADLVTSLYKNVLHRAPDAAGFADWTSRLEHGFSREALLLGFSESDENHAALVGVVKDGFEYQLYTGT